MALRFIDSFDHYATAQILSKWTTMANATINSGGRFGSCLVGNPGTAVKVLDAQATWVVGFAYRRSDTLPTTDRVFLAFVDGTTTHVDLRLTSAGTLRLTRAGTSLGLGTSVLSAGVWYYIEVKVTIADSPSGSAVVHLNSGVEITATGIDTRNAGNASADRISFALTGAEAIDDLYVCDGNASTPANNDFLGDCRVEAIFPSAAGNSAQWTPLSSTNVSNVDETSPPDGDTTYNSSSTANQVDSFAYTNLTPSSATVYGIQYNLYARKDDAGARTIAPLSRHSSTDYASATTHALSTSYAYYSQVMEQNPGTGPGNWTVTDVNGDEFGYKEIA